jgi:uncharacterized metal-binding protein YceD (DUF177 family)
MPESPEFSRPIRVDRIGNDGREITFTASEEERAALAARFDLEELPSLVGKAVLTRIAGGKLFRLDASFEADVVQTCVVTLDPLPAHLTEHFTMTYAAEADIEHQREVVIGEEEDPPEPLTDGTIDVGEAVAEHLSLALDPFPRKPGAEIPASPLGEEEERPHPFAALAQLKKSLEK